MVTKLEPNIKQSHGTPIRTIQRRPGVNASPNECFTYNRRTPWVVRTMDKGFVFKQEVVDVVLAGGQLKADGPRGMVTTVDRYITITSEYATILELHGRLHEIFTTKD